MLTPEQTRRNLLVEGLALNDLVGVTFTVGGVQLRGVDLARPVRLPPGAHPSPGCCAVARPTAVVVRAEILTSGPITVGDAVTISRLTPKRSV